MFYVGIDIAKQIHYAAVMTSDGEVLCEPFAFANDHQGFNMDEKRKVVCYMRVATRE